MYPVCRVKRNQTKSRNKEKKATKNLRRGRIAKKKIKSGCGFINKIIDKLPFELHVPSYQYCGPGTKLEERLKRGDPGINPLDAACKQHDISYSKDSDTTKRDSADKILQKEAMKRVFAKNSTLGERATALAVAAAMKAKRKLTKLGTGMRKNICAGKRKKTTKKRKKKEKKQKKVKKSKKKKKNVKKKNITFASLIKTAKVAMKKSNPQTIESAIEVAVDSINKSKNGKRMTAPPRIIKTPSISGGVLPLIPIFAGLSALGSIVGTTTGIIRSINAYKDGQKQLEENKRHNQKMEAIAIGNGFFLHPYKRGRGYFLKPQAKNI